MELFNIYTDPAYQHIVQQMTAALEKKMAEIGDEPEHIGDRRLANAG